MSYWLSMCSGFLKIMIFQQCSRDGHGMCDGSARCCACSQHLLSCIMFLLYVMTGLLGHVTPVRDDRPLGHIVHSAQLSQLSRKRPSLEVSSIQEEKRKKCTSNVGTCAQCLVMFLLSLTRTPWSAWPTFHSSWWYRTLHCVVMVAMQLPTLWLDAVARLIGYPTRWKGWTGNKWMHRIHSLQQMKFKWSSIWLICALSTSDFQFYIRSW